MGSPRRVHIEIVSDFVCPWCFIGEHRLRQALTLVPEIGVTLAWIPFQLNPWVPLNGMSRRDYRIYKFGSWARSLELDAQVTEAGRVDGLEFNFAQVARLPNTFDLHRLMQLARLAGDPGELAGRLMAAYFSGHADLSDTRQVIAIAVAAGLEADRVEQTLGSDSFAAQVRELEAAVRDSGTHGIPEFRIGTHRWTGAQSAASLVQHIRDSVGIHARA